jgi:hypothetical protein
MIQTIKKWFLGVHARPENPQRERRQGRDRRSRHEIVELDSSVADKIRSDDAGRNALVRNKYQREDSGTHETLKIIDDSIVDSGEETGIDPYNTGNFDRSRTWDKRFRRK